MMREGGVCGKTANHKEILYSNLSGRSVNLKYIKLNFLLPWKKCIWHLLDRDRRVYSATVNGHCFAEDSNLGWIWNCTMNYSTAGSHLDLFSLWLLTLYKSPACPDPGLRKHTPFKLPKNAAPGRVMTTQPSLWWHNLLWTFRSCRRWCVGWQKTSLMSVC